MKKWIKKGLIFGLFMFVFMALLMLLIQGSEIILRKVLISLVIWLIGGIAYGFLMKGGLKEKL